MTAPFTLYISPPFCTPGHQIGQFVGVRSLHPVHLPSLLHSGASDWSVCGCPLPSPCTSPLPSALRGIRLVSLWVSAPFTLYISPPFCTPGHQIGQFVGDRSLHPVHLPSLLHSGASDWSVCGCPLPSPCTSPLPSALRGIRLVSLWVTDPFTLYISPPFCTPGHQIGQFVGDRSHHPVHLPSLLHSGASDWSVCG